MTKNTKKDPRCPVCGNAVLQNGVAGNEGTYHFMCTQPPLQFVPPTPPVFVPLDTPRPWNQPQWTCESRDAFSVN